MIDVGSPRKIVDNWTLNPSPVSWRRTKNTKGGRGGSVAIKGVEVPVAHLSQWSNMVYVIQRQSTDRSTQFHQIFLHWRRSHEMKCGTQIGQGRPWNGRRFTEKPRTRTKRKGGGGGGSGIRSGVWDMWRVSWGERSEIDVDGDDVWWKETTCDAGTRSGGGVTFTAGCCVVHCERPTDELVVGSRWRTIREQNIRSRMKSDLRSVCFPQSSEDVGIRSTQRHSQSSPIWYQHRVRQLNKQ